MFELNIENKINTHMPLILCLNNGDRGYYVEYVDIHNHPSRWYSFFKEQIYIPPIQRSQYFQKNENCRIQDLNVLII